MAWEEDDNLNDPSLYTPRNAPRVRNAEARPSDTETATVSDYVFDDGATWDSALTTLPAYRRTKPTRGSGSAANDADNPYARRRTAPNGTNAGVAARPRAEEPPARAKGKPVLYASVIALCMGLLAVICVMMMPQLAGYFWKDFGNFAFVNGELLNYDRKLVNNYKQYREVLRQEIIYQGVFVDGVHVGGLTVEQAKQTLGGDASAAANAFSLTVAIGNKTWTLDNTSIPATRNLDTVLKHAYALGRQNTTAIIGTMMTPFRERVDSVLTMLNQYVYLKSTSTYDHDAVRQKVDEITAYVTRAPVDSQILSFDPNSRTFTFTEDQPGVTVDANALYQQIVAKLDQGVQGETITVTPTITAPSVTKSDLMNSFKLVAAFTTETTSAKNRNNNINLACQAINGKVLLPGETFSFNEATGRRTTDKGYQSAGAIAAGQSIEEVGGGICQVSSTLFNAVARADLEIVSRSPHAWPSTYVKIGEDATVNWPNLDFKFKNNKSTPVFVIAYYRDRKCSAEIWGMSLGAGVTIDLESKVIRTIEAPTGVNYVQNPELPTGDSEETIKARNGSVVDTYQVWYQNGQEVKRTLLHTSTYKAYQRTIEYN